VTFGDDLLKRMQARDPDARTALEKCLMPGLRALCERLLRNREMARETAADVWSDFVAVHVDRIRRGAAIPSFLEMTAIRRCTRVRDFEARYEAPVDVPDARPGPEELLAAARESRRSRRGSLAASSGSTTAAGISSGSASSTS